MQQLMLVGYREATCSSTLRAQELRESPQSSGAAKVHRAQELCESPQSSGAVWKSTELRSCVKVRRAQELCESPQSSGAVWQSTELRSCVKGHRAQELCESPQSSGAVWKSTDLRSCGKVRRAQELWESRGGRPGLTVPNSPYGLCGRKQHFKKPCVAASSAFDVQWASHLLLWGVWPLSVGVGRGCTNRPILAVSQKWLFFIILLLIAENRVSIADGWNRLEWKTNKHFCQLFLSPRSDIAQNKPTLT